MRRLPGDAVKEFEELRRLLLSKEREQLQDLQDRLASKEQRSRDVAAVLPEAVKLSRERGEDLTRALRPAVESSIRESIEQRPGAFVDALHPIIGPIVRRSIAESLRRLLQSLNQTLEHTFSWRGLKWRFEALRTGRSFAEVVMLRSLVYRVEQVFLIHRQTSMTLLHVAADAAVTRDADMVGGMLSAIQDFARDSFATGKNSALEEFKVGELEVWIAPGPSAYLAAVIRGTPPRELRNTLEEAIDSIHILKGPALASFKGDAAAFESLRPELEACLRAQYSAEDKPGRTGRAGFLLTALAALIAAAIVMAVRSEMRWKNFLARLSDQPGIVVTDAHKGWFSASRVSGLRDAASNDPAVLARQAGLDPTHIRFDWKDYLALDDPSVQRRFEQRFGVPPGTEIFLNHGVLNVAGRVPYEWMDRVRHDAIMLPGLTRVVDAEAKISYDRNRSLERFEKQFDLPDSVHAILTNGTLKLTGEASHAWLSRVRAMGNKVPGIKAVELKDVVDVDQRDFAESKSILENAFVYFLVNKDNIATEGFAALSRVPDQLRRCATAAKRLGAAITLEIDGFADAVGPETKNADLSRRRAERVRDFIVSCGFDPAMLRAVGMGERAEPAPGEKPLPEEAERRVAFKIFSQPVATP
jgi:outer membrane protein OmpA-like peptidoglycan-associated protein